MRRAFILVTHDYPNKSVNLIGQNMTSHGSDQSVDRKDEGDPEWLRLVRQHVSSLKFGTVQITVHDARVTQVERSEKVRLDGQNTVKNKIN